MPEARRAVKILSTTMIAGAMFSQEADAQSTVIITAPSSANYSCCYYTAGYDGYMTDFFGRSTMSDTGFSFPESEAYAFLYAGWLWKNDQPKPHFTFQACAADPRITDATRQVTKDSDPMERLAAANQMLSTIIPNFVNTKKDGLLVKIIFTDGTSEVYRHTSFYGWQAVTGTLTNGNGVAGSTCSV